MIIRFVYGTLFLMALSCNSKNTENYKQKPGSHDTGMDTIVWKRDLTKTGLGACYKEKVYQYFLLAGKDTCDFTCCISNSKLNGTVYVDLHASTQNKTTYQQKINGLGKILPVAAKDFNLKNIKSLRIGQLIETGDLAIYITKQYEARFGVGKPIGHYSAISEFLKESTLGTDLNSLFKPYAISISHIDVEKVSFTTKEALYNCSKPETNFALAPDAILDCMTWVSLRKD